MPIVALGFGRSRWSAPFAPFVAAVVLCLGSGPLALIATPSAAADPLIATTLPIPDEGTARWFFSGDKVIGLTEGTKDGDLIGHFNAYSLAEPKALWHVDQVLGNKDLKGDMLIRSTKAKDQWLVGKGPLSLLDVSAGTVKWTIPCEQSGFLMLDRARLLSGDRLLVPGSKKCDASSNWNALKEPTYAMINIATGQVLWRSPTKSLEYDSSLGAWARVAQYQGPPEAKGKYQQLVSMLLTKGGEFDEIGIREPDRLVIAGEQWECIRLSDGVSLMGTKEKPGILRGAYDGAALFRDGDKVSAYTPAGANPIWTLDLKKNSVAVYTVDDLVDQGHGVPDGMGDILTSESDVVSRVTMETGRPSWTLKCNGMRWAGSKHAFLTESKDKVFAYDWKTAAKMWEAKVPGKPKPTDAGDVILFVAGGKYVDGIPQAPLTLTAVKGSGGQTLWSRKDIDGKKIKSWQLVSGKLVRLTNEKGTVANLKVADGTPAEPPPQVVSKDEQDQQGGFFVAYLENEKTLQCRNFSGALVWQRKGESSMSPAYKMGKGCVVWASKDGTVEVIGLADGASMWLQKVDAKSPQPAVSDDGATMVVQNKNEVSIVKLGS